MKVLDAESSRLLCNLEVLEILRRSERRDAAHAERGVGGVDGAAAGASGAGGSSSAVIEAAGKVGSLEAARASEVRVRQALEHLAAGKQTHASVKAFLGDPELRHMPLAHKLCLVNVQPKTEVGIFPIVEESPNISTKSMLHKLNKLAGEQAQAEGAGEEQE